MLHGLAWHSSQLWERSPLTYLAFMRQPKESMWFLHCILFWTLGAFMASWYLWYSPTLKQFSWVMTNVDKVTLFVLEFKHMPLKDNFSLVCPWTRSSDWLEKDLHLTCPGKVPCWPITTGSEFIMCSSSELEHTKGWVLPFVLFVMQQPFNFAVKSVFCRLSPFKDFSLQFLWHVKHCFKHCCNTTLLLPRSSFPKFSFEHLTQLVDSFSYARANEYQYW